MEDICTWHIKSRITNYFTKQIRKVCTVKLQIVQNRGNFLAENDYPGVEINEKRGMHVLPIKES